MPSAHRLTALASALDPAGEGAERIAELWWVLLAATLVPFVVVVVVLVLGLLRGRGDVERPPLLERLSDRQFVLLGGVGLPVLVIVPVVAMTIGVARSLEGAAAQPSVEGLRIEVHGHQFWWDLRYPAPGASDPRASGSFRTANEIHIPVDTDVTLVLTSEDVIHSFWVPQLHGKIDLIPGRVNELTIRADRPGTYEGRCGEFCGLGHAAMRLVVIAHEEERFREWWRREAGPVDPAALAAADQGLRQTFANSCGPCHTVREMFESPDVFAGDFGPDLTHLASRNRLGNLVPNTREGLGRWIVDPQGVKPGNKMPDVGLEGDDLAEIVEFLRRLR